MPSIKSFFSYHTRKAKLARLIHMMAAAKNAARESRMARVYSAARKYHKSALKRKYHSTWGNTILKRRVVASRHLSGVRRTRAFPSAWYKHKNRRWNKRKRSRF